MKWKQYKLIDLRKSLGLLFEQITMKEGNVFGILTQ